MSEKLIREQILEKMMECIKYVTNNCGYKSAFNFIINLFEDYTLENIEKIMEEARILHSESFRDR